MLARKMKLSSLILVLLATAAESWTFTIYGDGSCNSAVTGDLRGSGNRGTYLTHSR